MSTASFVKIALTVVVILIALVGVAAFAGSRLPRIHEATRTALLARPPAEVYALVRNFGAMPLWRKNLKAVDTLPDLDGKPAFREVGRHGGVLYVVLADEPPAKIVTKIADDTLPYGGTWTYEISAEGPGSRIRITERGEIKNVIFRLLACHVFGYTATIENYLRDLGRQFGQTVSIQP